MLSLDDFKELALPGLFFVYFQEIKIVDFTGIHIQIIGAEGKLSDHLSALDEHQDQDLDLYLFKSKNAHLWAEIKIFFKRVQFYLANP